MMALGTLYLRQSGVYHGRVREIALWAWLWVFAIASGGCASAPGRADDGRGTTGASGPGADAALAKAICQGDVATVKKRLAAGVSVDAVYEDCSLLQGAAACDRADVAKLLLDSGAKPSTRNAKGVSAIHVAAAAGSARTVKLLLEHHVAVDEVATTQLTALHYAAIAQQSEVLKLLLAHGANPNARDEGGRLPLEYVSGIGATDVAKILLAAGADPTLMRENRSVIEYAETPAMFELLRDAIWAREPKRAIALPLMLVMKVLDAEGPKAIACYERAQPRPAEHELGLVLDIEPEGKVGLLEPTALDGNVRDPAVVKCIEELMRALTFPQASEPRRFIHTFELAGP